MFERESKYTLPTQGQLILLAQTIIQGIYPCRRANSFAARVGKKRSGDRSITFCKFQPWARRIQNRSKLPGMVDLKPWLGIQGLTVRDFALGLDVPLKTAEDWVYRGVVPSTGNQAKLADYVHAHCAHYWVIAVPNGPISEGVCQRCGHVREFKNSAEYTLQITKPRNAADKVAEGKSAT